MKLVRKYIEKDGSGRVTLLPEEPEDMVCLIHHLDYITIH